MKIASAGTTAPMLLLRLLTNSLWMSREMRGPLAASWRCQMRLATHFLSRCRGRRLETSAVVYALRAVLQKALQKTVSNGGFAGTDRMSVAFGWVTTLEIGSETVLSSTRWAGLARNPVCRLRKIALWPFRMHCGGGSQKVVMSCVLVVVFEGLGTFFVGSKMA